MGGIFRGTNSEGWSVRTTVDRPRGTRPLEVVFVDGSWTDDSISRVTPVLTAVTVC
jgi:hypothetical protein